MAEPVGLFPWELRRLGADELLAHEREQARRLRFAVRERLDRALVEDAALRPTPRSRTARSAGSSWSRRAARSAWIVGGTLTSASPEARTRASISSRKSGLPSAAASDRWTKGRGSTPPSSSSSRSVSAASSGSRSTVVEFHLPPPQAGRFSSSSGPRHAEREERRIARQVGDMLDQFEERLLRPVQVVEHTHRADAAAPPARGACGIPTRSRPQTSPYPSRRGATGGEQRRRCPAADAAASRSRPQASR